MITRGIARYIYLDSTEKFKGSDTGKYTLTIELAEDEALKLENLGIKVNEFVRDGRTYKARKFSTRYPLTRDMIQTKSGKSIGVDFGEGSGVEVLWKEGKDSTYGIPTFLVAIKVDDDYNPGYKGRSDELSRFFNDVDDQSKISSVVSHFKSFAAGI